MLFCSPNIVMVLNILLKGYMCCPAPYYGHSMIISAGS